MDLRRHLAAEGKAPRAEQVFHLVKQQHGVRSLPQHAGRHGQFGQPFPARRLSTVIVGFSHRAQVRTDLARQHLGEFRLSGARRAVEQDVHPRSAPGQRSGQQVAHKVGIASQSLEILPFSLRRSRAREHQRDQVGNAFHLGQKREGQAVRQVERHPVVTPAAVALNQSRTRQSARGAHGGPDFGFRRRAEPRQKQRHRDLLRFKRPIDNKFKPVEQLVEGNERQHGGLDRGQPEMIPKEGSIALHDLALAAPCSGHEVARDGPDLVPPLCAWPGTGALGAFHFGQVFQPAGQLLGNAACRTETVGQSGDQIKGEVSFVGHCPSP